VRGRVAKPPIVAIATAVSAFQFNCVRSSDSINPRVGEDYMKNLMFRFPILGSIISAIYTYVNVSRRILSSPLGFFRSDFKEINIRESVSFYFGSVSLFLLIEALHGLLIGVNPILSKSVAYIIFYTVLVVSSLVLYSLCRIMYGRTALS
jgi:hypothetical protein